MASSGTYVFAPDNADLIEEAFERCGKDPAVLIGRHFTSAIRSINLLFAHWTTKGVKLFQVDEQTQAMTASDPTYNVASGTLLLLNCVIRRDGIDTPVRLITREEYQAIPDKDEEGLPTQVWHNRAAGEYTLWQEPENATDVFRYFRLRRIQDAGTGQQTPDLPLWWFEALAMGLAEFLSLKFAPERFQLLRELAAERLADAVHEDRERGDTSFGMSPL